MLGAFCLIADRASSAKCDLLLHRSAIRRWIIIKMACYADYMRINNIWCDKSHFINVEFKSSDRLLTGVTVSQGDLYTFAPSDI